MAIPSEYWAKRAADTQQHLTDKSIADTNKQINKYYLSSMKKVIREFEATYDKLLATAADGKDPTPADLYKLGKYWEMQGQIQRELEKLGDRQHNVMSKNFADEYTTIYRAIALTDDLHFDEIDNAMVQQMINQIWCADGKNWSQRIWTNTNQLRETLNEHLIHCVLTGKKTSELKQILQEDFGVSYSRADRIVRTEMAHIQTQAAHQRYLDAGITEVEVWASKDERRCDICGQLHQKRFNINEQMPIPAHSNCRCCIIPVVEIE